MDITKEQIEKMATEYAKQFDYAEDSSPFLDYIAGFEKALSLFAVSGQLPPSDCSKCGRGAYSKGKPFCTDEFCNGGNFR
jgi:hypothetical protein